MLSQVIAGVASKSFRACLLHGEVDNRCTELILRCACRLEISIGEHRIADGVIHAQGIANHRCRKSGPDLYAIWQQTSELALQLLLGLGRPCSYRREPQPAALPQTTTSQTRTRLSTTDNNDQTAAICHALVLDDDALLGANTGLVQPPFEHGPCLGTDLRHHALPLRLGSSPVRHHLAYRLLDIDLEQPEHAAFLAQWVHETGCGKHQ